MVATFQKIMLLIISIDIFLYLGSGFALAVNPNSPNVIKVQGDFLDLFLKNRGAFDYSLSEHADSLLGKGNASTTINYDLSDDWGVVPVRESGQPAVPSIGFAFLDPISLVFGFIITLFNMTILPITLLSIGLSPFIVLIIGFPLTASFIAGLFMLFRGVS